MDLLVDRDLATGESTDEVDDAVDAFVGIRAVDHPVHGDGARVDQRVARPTGLGLERDLVEGVAGRFGVDAFEYGVEPAVAQGECVGRYLADGLDGELVIGVAGGVHGAVDGGQGDTERRRIRLLEFTIAARDLTAVVVAAFGEYAFEVVVDGGAHIPR